MNCIELFVTKSIRSVITDKDTGNCKYSTCIMLWKNYIVSCFENVITNATASAPQNNNLIYWIEVLSWMFW